MQKKQTSSTELDDFSHGALRSLCTEAQYEEIWEIQPQSDSGEKSVVSADVSEWLWS